MIAQLQRRSSAHKPAPSAKPAAVVRCAIYTRKSTEEGLQQEFNSLDSQRSYAEKYIASQESEGWICLPEHYDDGGYTGGNIERPALQRLLSDIEAGNIDCVVVYKVDRLSRSLLDFARLMEVFDRHEVSFVSVTQSFNTTQSMGRLTLNILLSFAQFEREINSERTRDKIAAAKRKGKYAGGLPILGYDIVRSSAGSRLVVNAEEANRVRQIFELYLAKGSLIPTVQELTQRGWTNKRWQTRKGRQHGGRPFDKCSLYNLLTRVTYAGKVSYRDEVYTGEHEAIVPMELWQKVQAQLLHNGRNGGSEVRNKHGALLKGIVRCSACDCAMVHTYTAKGNRRYRYYTCLHAQKRGWKVCPTKSVPAAEIEAFVIERIRCIGQDPALARQTLSKSQEKTERQVSELQTEHAVLARQLHRLHEQVRKASVGKDEVAAGRLADLEEQIAAAETRGTQIDQEISVLEQQRLAPQEIAAALSEFDQVWEALSPSEQAKLIRLLVAHVGCDGRDGSVSIRFHPARIKTLVQRDGSEVQSS